MARHEKHVATSNSIKMAAKYNRRRKAAEETHEKEESEE